MKTANKVVSIVTSAFNEELCIVELIEQYRQLEVAEPNYNFSFILVDNGSTDSTLKLMQENSQKLQGSVEILKLSRNFRDGGGLKAGLSRASGDALVLMSADLQDHPNFISNFLRLWEDGYKNVYAEIESRNGAKFLRQINSKIFYKVAFILSGRTITQNASDFRLLDRSVYEALRMAPEYNKFLRGYISWLGFSSIGVKQDRPNRFAGESKAGTIDTINYALKGILSNSSVPLRLVSLANLILCISQLIYFFSALISGSTSDKILTYLMNTLIAFSFVIISEYMIVIYQETKQRPQFVVEDILSIKKS
jgi:dolichol-phosphate mannosyltransferase